MQFAFGKKESQLIKGVAIIAMFYHHFFGFAQWLAPECDFSHTYVNGRCVEYDIASFCKICVGIYAFVSGYASFVQDAKFRNIKSIIKRILSFLCNYWFVFTIFILFGIIFNEPFPPIERFLLQCIGVSTATGFNWDYFNAIHPVFAWYVSFYILFVVISPLLAKICKYNFFIDLCLVTGILFGINFYSCNMLPEEFSIIKILITAFATWGHIGMIGFLFAKYNVFGFIHNMLAKYLSNMAQFVLLIFVLVHIYCLWIFEDKRYIFESDIVKVSYFALFTPVLIYAITYILSYINCKVFNSILIALSKESINMWFLHGLFFSPKKTIQWIAYLPRHPLFILIWTLFLMYYSSVVIRRIYGYIFQLYKKIMPTKKDIRKK